MTLAVALPTTPPPTVGADVAKTGAGNEDASFGDLLSNAASTADDAKELKEDAPKDAPKDAIGAEPPAPVGPPQPPVTPAPVLLQLVVDQPVAPAADDATGAATPAVAPAETPPSSQPPTGEPRLGESGAQAGGGAAAPNVAPTSSPPSTKSAEAAPAPSPIQPQDQSDQPAALSATPPEAAAPTDPAALASAVAAPQQPRPTTPSPKSAPSKATVETSAETTPAPSPDEPVPTNAAAEAEPVEATSSKSHPDRGGARQSDVQSQPDQFAVQKTNAEPAQPTAPAQLPPSDPTISVRVDAPKTASSLATAHAGAQVAQEIVRRFEGDSTSFELRLDPPELGRVEVRLEVSRDNKVTAVVSADNPQALTELARNARDLQNALQAAGLELNENGLSFDLRQGGRESGGAQDGRPAQSNANAEASAEPAPLMRTVSLDPWRGGAIDLMA